MSTVPIYPLPLRRVLLAIIFHVDQNFPDVQRITQLSLAYYGPTIVVLTRESRPW